MLRLDASRCIRNNSITTKYIRMLVEVFREVVSLVLLTREIIMPTSKTQAFIDHIRSKIASGEWPPGYQLPSRVELMAEHRVSLTVVRDAQNYLRTLGELVSVPSVGYFVPEEPGGG